VISERAYLILLVAIAGERVLELILSRRNVRLALSRGGIEVGQSHYPVMVIFHVLFLVWCAIASLTRARPFASGVATLALGGTIAAQALRYWVVRTLGERWNTRVIVVPGEAPVTSGPFRYLRHPNYLAVVMELACLPLIRGLWLTAIVFSIANAALLTIRIPLEERALGASYAQAFASRRRFVPRIG
jgi:methyltransferase